MKSAMRGMWVAVCVVWSAGAWAVFDEDNVCQEAGDQIKSARSDLTAALAQYQACIGSGKDDACEAEFSKLRSAQASFHEAVDHRQQACSY